MRNVAVVTVSRADYSYLRPVIKELCAGGRVNVQLIVAAGHLVSEMGDTHRVVESDGVRVAATVPMTQTTDDAQAIASSMARGLEGFARHFVSLRPDIVLLLGDRYETLAAATAALTLGVVIGHIAGGESSEGAMDEQIRHAITKMAHLHFVSTAVYRDRLHQMGEDPAFVHLTGAPSIDAAAQARRLEPRELETTFDLRLDPPPLLVTFHPATRDSVTPEEQVDPLLDALRVVDLPVIFTEPNADTGGRAIRARIDAFLEANPRHRLVQNFGTDAYFSLLPHVGAMVGNSSSGIIEAASFGLPVVNIGPRQQGRVRGANVIDADGKAEAIVAAIRKTQDARFRERISRMTNPYGGPGAAAAIARVLENVSLDDRLRVKRFRTLSGPLTGTGQ